MWRDEHTGLYHTHYRILNPNHARWLTPDPKGYVDGQNLYRFYGGPNSIDVLGLEDEGKKSFKEAGTGDIIDSVNVLWTGPAINKSSLLFTKLRLQSSVGFTRLGGMLYTVKDYSNTYKSDPDKNGKVYEKINLDKGNLEIADFAGYYLVTLEAYARGANAQDSSLQVA